MLTHENNEIVCRVGRGTPMGDLMRQYWIPALPSNEFAGPDAVPKRMMLLGERLVMFRDTEGRACILAAMRTVACAAPTMAGSLTSRASASTRPRNNRNGVSASAPRS